MRLGRSSVLPKSVSMQEGAVVATGNERSHGRNEQAAIAPIDSSKTGVGRNAEWTRSDQRRVGSDGNVGKQRIDGRLQCAAGERLLYHRVGVGPTARTFSLRVDLVMEAYLRALRTIVQGIHRRAEDALRLGHFFGHSQLHQVLRADEFSLVGELVVEVDGRNSRLAVEQLLLHAAVIGARVARPGRAGCDIARSVAARWEPPPGSAATDRASCSRSRCWAL